MSGYLVEEGSGGKVYRPEDLGHGILRGEWLSCRGRGQGVRCIVRTTLSTVF